MADLCPQVVTVASTRCRHPCKRIERILGKFTVDDDVTGSLEVVTIYLNIPREQDAGTTVTPNAVESF